MGGPSKAPGGIGGGLGTALDGTDRFVDFAVGRGGGGGGAGGIVALAGELLHSCWIEGGLGGGPGSYLLCRAHHRALNVDVSPRESLNRLGCSCGGCEPFSIVGWRLSRLRLVSHGPRCREYRNSRASRMNLFLCHFRISPYSQL